MIACTRVSMHCLHGCMRSHVRTLVCACVRACMHAFKSVQVRVSLFCICLRARSRACACTPNGNRQGERKQNIAQQVYVYDCLHIRALLCVCACARVQAHTDVCVHSCVRWQSFVSVRAVRCVLACAFFPLFVRVFVRVCACVFVHCRACSICLRPHMRTLCMCWSAYLKETMRMQKRVCM